MAVRRQYVVWLTDDCELVLYDSCTVTVLATDVTFNIVTFTVCGQYIVTLKKDFATVYSLKGEVLFSGHTFAAEKYAFDVEKYVLTNA